MIARGTGEEEETGDFSTRRVALVRLNGPELAVLLRVVRGQTSFVGTH